MLHDYFKARGLRDKVKLRYNYPVNHVHATANVARWAKPLFDEAGIEYETFFNVKEVDPAKRIVYSEEGSEVQYDLLIAIPPHRGMQVIEENKLGDAGWIPTDRFKLTMEGRDNVYVIGDAGNVPVSKTGSVAHCEAELVADYCRHAGRASIEGWPFYVAFAMFRPAALSQGLAGRVRDGTAANANAAQNAAAVRPLAETAWAFAKRAGATG